MLRREGPRRGSMANPVTDARCESSSSHGTTFVDEVHPPRVPPQLGRGAHGAAPRPARHRRRARHPGATARAASSTRRARRASTTTSSSWSARSAASPTAVSRPADGTYAQDWPAAARSTTGRDAYCPRHPPATRASSRSGSPRKAALVRARIGAGRPMRFVDSIEPAGEADTRLHPGRRGGLAVRHRRLPRHPQHAQLPASSSWTRRRTPRPSR